MPVVNGDEFANTLDGTSDDDTINGYDGSDTINLSTGHDAIDGGNGFDTIRMNALAPLPGLPSSSRSYLITANNISDASGTLDTSFTAVESLSLSDLSGYDVILDASGHLGNLTFVVGGGNHRLTTGSGTDFLAMASGPNDMLTAVIDGGAGADTLSFMVTPGETATFTRSGNVYVLDGETVQSAEIYNIETISITPFGGAVDASQVDVPIAFNLVSGQSGVAVGGSAGDTFVSSSSGGADRILTGGGGADRFAFGSFSPDHSAMDGTTILDFGIDDVLDLNSFSSNRYFGGSDPLGSSEAYGIFSFRGATFVAGDWGSSLLTIASGAFVLEETAPGSNMLMIAGSAPAPDPAANVIVGTMARSVLEGGAGNDAIHAADRDTLIDGGTGDDLINGGGAQDTIFGGSGNDVIDGGDGFDTVRGEDGNDTLTGTGFEADWMMGGRGDDTLIAHGGVWHLYGGDDPVAGWSGGWNDGFGGEDLSGENDGNDRITLDNGYLSSIDGGSGDDTITIIGGGGNVANGSTGDDTLIGGAGADSLDGGAGIDTLSYAGSAANVFVRLHGFGAQAGTQYAFGGDANGDVLVGLSFEYATGGKGADDLIGSAIGNVLDGGAGNDTLNGYLGNDTLIGGAGADTLNGGEGIDTLSYAGSTANVFVRLHGFGVQAGTQYAFGGDANGDVLVGLSFENATGGNGSDNIIGSSGTNVLGGGAGNDTLSGYLGNDTLIGGGGADNLNGGEGIDTLSYAGSIAGVSVRLQGFGAQAGTQYAFGGDANGDVLVGLSFEYATGGSGNDDIIGSSIGNLLRGEGGNDVLNGYLGNDWLVGGAGNDVFRFTSAPSGSNRDTITDYSVADDTIQIDNAVFAGLAAGVLAAGAFNTGAAASQADDRIVYNSATGAVLFDADGSGAGAAVHFATLSTGLAMTAAEFVVI